MVGTILIAMEDAKQRRQVAEMLMKEGHRVIEAETDTRAYDLLRRRTNISLVLVDIGGSTRREDACLDLIRQVGGRVPVVVLATKEDEPGLIKAMDAGAHDFFLLPLTPLRVKISLSNLFQHYALMREIRAIDRYGEEHLKFDELIAKSESMQQLIEKAKLLVEQPHHLLLLAEAGCAPMLYARTLHREDMSRSGAFVSLQCGFHADKEQEISSDWQHKLASAVTQSRHGTLFLSDVHLLGKGLQQHLLNVIERLKSGREGQMMDVRFIASVPSDIDARVLEGEFDENLCALLGESRLVLPPLRMRRDDMGELINVLLSRLLVETGRLHIRGVSEQAQALLLQYEWPGNVTELENALFRAVLLCEGNELDLVDFPQIAGKNSMFGYDISEKILFMKDNHVRPLVEIEAHVIAAALKHYRGRISEVARRLRIGRSTLYRKMEEYNLMRDVV